MGAHIAAVQKEGNIELQDDGSVRHSLASSLTGVSAEEALGHMRFRVLSSATGATLTDNCARIFCTPISHENERQALQALTVLLEKLPKEPAQPAVSRVLSSLR